jgi:hypothetical protein
MPTLSTPGRLRRIARLWPELPLAAGVVSSLVSGAHGRWNTPVLRDWYWYLVPWLLFRTAKEVARRPRLRQVALYIASPLTILLSHMVTGVIEWCFVRMEWDELLDYLSGKQFDPVVMCATRNQPFSRRSATQTTCERRFCRFGSKLGLPQGIDKKKVPGSRRLWMGMRDGASGDTSRGRLESWSAGDVALKVKRRKTNGLDGQIVVRPRLLSLRQKIVEVDLLRPRPGDARRLIVASSPWEASDYLKYKPGVPAFPRHGCEPIDKEQPWWKAAIRNMQRRPV